MVAAFLLGSLVHGQATFSYDFTGTEGDPWGVGDWTNHLDPDGSYSLYSYSLYPEHAMEVGGERMGAMIQFNAGATGQWSGVATSSFDLVTQSLVFRQTWSPGTGGLSNGSDPSDFGVNELFQMGLVAQDDLLAAPLQDSFFLSGLEMDAIRMDPENSQWTNQTQLQLSYRDEQGSLIDFHTAWFPQSERIVDGNGEPIGVRRYVYDITQTFSHVASGSFDVDLNIDRHFVYIDWNTGVRTDHFDANVLSTSLTGLGSNLEPDVLQALYPSLGMNVVNSLSLSNSGANFDVVPEPATGLLGLLGTTLLWWRRRRVGPQARDLGA